jgi:hypothetical protein
MDAGRDALLDRNGKPEVTGIGRKLQAAHRGYKTLCPGRASTIYISGS